MNIKKRLIISNTITVLIPFIITIIVASMYIFISSKMFEEDVSYNNFKKLVLIEAELYDTKNDIWKQKADNIEDPRFQQELSKKLLSINGEIIIIKNNSTIFASKDISKIDIEKCLQSTEHKSPKKIAKVDNNAYVVEVVPLKFTDGVDGNVILLAPAGKELDGMQKFIITIVLVFVISFIAANIFTSYSFSKRILKPITLLKNAAGQISTGDLECEIIQDGDEEIRELCADFEKMRVQLKDSIRMKMRYDDNRKMLVSSISHDLKTPITSIKGYVEGIMDGVANNPEKLRKYLTTIYSKAEQMDVMIDDLLLYSKLDLNQIPFDFQKVNILEYFSYCVQESTLELEKYNIKIRLENSLEEAKYVMIDSQRLKRVIINIIDNSRKYMGKEQGEIIIMLRETNSSIVIEIKDSGVGIDKEHIDKIFDKFYRGDLARSGTKGSGLGLAIAKQIVEGHRGKIWVISEENKGTSILISLAKISGE